LKHTGIYNDNEAKAGVQELFSYEKFVTGMNGFLPPALSSQILASHKDISSIYDFQKDVIHPFLGWLIDQSTSGISASGLEALDKDDKYLFISNHRDISLDPAFVNLMLFDNGFTTVQIAIGDNLMKHRVAELIFRINKSFVVQRSGSSREIYQSSVALSEYISETIRSKTDSVWIAQKEGRAKDGNDKTQVGVLKMLHLSSNTKDYKHLETLKIVPVALSYEYDPCDYLKTREHLNRKYNSNYKKTFEEDVHSILQGIKGMKGKVHVSFGKPLSDLGETIQNTGAPKLVLEKVAHLIDTQIHNLYKLNPVNYVAYDLLYDEKRLADRYSNEEEEQVIQYFEEIIHRFSPDLQVEARDYLLGIYANPVKNALG